MHHQIRAAMVALIVIAASSTTSYAEDSKGDKGAPKSSAGGECRQHKFNT